MKKKTLLGILIFAIVITLTIIDPLIYRDIINGIRIDRMIKSHSFQELHFSLFEEMSLKKANDLLLKHGDALLEQNHYKSLVYIEDYNIDGNLDLLLAEANYQIWERSSMISGPFEKLASLRYANKLAQGTVDRYFVPDLIFHLGLGEEIFSSRHYLSEEYETVYNDYIGHELALMIIELIERDVIYTSDAKYWWVPTDLNIQENKQEAIEYLLDFLHEDSPKIYDRTIHHILNSEKESSHDSVLRSYLKENNIYEQYIGKYMLRKKNPRTIMNLNPEIYDKLAQVYPQLDSIKDMDIITNTYQHIIKDGGPYLYIKGIKSTEEDSISGYYKINLTDGSSEFTPFGEKNIIWRQDGKYAINQEHNHDFDSADRMTVESIIEIYDENLELIDKLVFDEQFYMWARWVGAELILEGGGVRRAYKPETGELKKDKLEIDLENITGIAVSYYTHEGVASEQILLPIDLGRGSMVYTPSFRYFGEDGELIYETEQNVKVDSIAANEYMIIYRVYKEIGFYVYDFKEEKLNFIETTAEPLAIHEDGIYVLNFLDINLSVLSKMNMSGEIEKKYNYYNPFTEINTIGKEVETMTGRGSQRTLR
ncbi:hypothetical protein HYG86_12900 [Alkalicella caledoniensis]|uniref:Uncharacterized protein n=1 Tax=Alkalicella caledoniensis TaxID=2731377 RepID=A0A7G9WA94_ALKCA|nr:hypothetical protein [Alkalicella caledoniensis]QNO15606.1 hypothetical protein HYG86_12900 [Alkalicella caledoniensis]